MCSLSERRLVKAEPPSPPNSTAVTEFPGGGQTEIRLRACGQACSKFQHGGGLPVAGFDLPFGHFRINDQSLSDPRGDPAFARALLLARLELPCDTARLQSRSSIKRGQRRGGIASGPAVAVGLLLVGGEPGDAGLPPTFVEVCSVRHGPLFLGLCRGLRVVS